jgi:CRISPR-associated protein Cmr3
MKYNLSVTLTPLEHFFFGGENRNNDGTEKYLQKSLTTPQQTTILGTIRYLLLQNAGKETFDNNKIVSKSKARDLIGESSFDMKVSKYGIIESLSEVLLWKGGFYCPLIAWENAAERKNNKTSIINTEIQGNKEGVFFFDKETEKESITLPEYNMKYETHEYWISEKEELETDKIFKSQIQAGNYKNKNKKKEEEKEETINNDDAYFKMNFYRFNDKFSFVFNMKISDEENGNQPELVKNIIEKLTGKKHFVNLGGERSKFICEINSIEETPEKEIKEDVYQKVYSKHFDNKYHKIILTSDAFVEEKKNPYSDSTFASTKIQKIRFHQTDNNTKKYHNRGADGFKISELFNLLQRGSVFYFDAEDKIEDFLNNGAFKIIGYNKYYKLKK